MKDGRGVVVVMDVIGDYHGVGSGAMPMPYEILLRQYITSRTIIELLLTGLSGHKNLAIERTHLLGCQHVLPSSAVLGDTAVGVESTRCKGWFSGASGCNSVGARVVLPLVLCDLCRLVTCNIILYNIV